MCRYSECISKVVVDSSFQTSAFGASSSGILQYTSTSENMKRFWIGLNFQCLSRKGWAGKT